MLALYLLLGVGACSPGPTPVQQVEIEIIKPTPNPTVRLITEATKVKKDTAKKVLDAPVGNDFLIQIIGLTHKLDVAVAALKKNPTTESRASVQRAVDELERVAKQGTIP